MQEPLLLKQRAKSYAFVFENVRAMAAMLSPAELQWVTELGNDTGELPFILHLSCMAHLTPHIAYIAQRVLEKLGIDCPIVGGPEHCCGGYHHVFGDRKLERKTALTTLHSFKRAKPTTVLSICPSCDERFAEHTTSSIQFRHGNISGLLVEHLGRLRRMTKPVNKRVILHAHDYNEARKQDQENIRTILNAVPGIELVPAVHARGEGKDCTPRNLLPAEQIDRLCTEAKELGVEYLIMPYHSCYRQNCQLQLSSGLEVYHYFDIVAMSLGIAYDDPFKRLRLLDNLDEAVASLRPKWERLGYREDNVRAFLQHSIYG